jgi:hypothetical protein
MKTFGAVGEENKKSTRKKMPKLRLFIITDFNVFVQFFE